MPLVALACLAYAAGLFAGFGLPPSIAAVVVAALLVGGAAALALPDAGLRREHATALLIAAAGGMAALAAADHAARCARDLPRAAALHARLEDDAEAGALVRAQVREGDCRSDAVIVVAEGSAHAGDEVVVRGEVVGRERGLLVRRATIAAAHATHGAAALRARVGRRIDRVFGDDAPLVRALVIADMHAIPAEQRDRFARAGLVHMLSVSGLHVAIVALALMLLASALRVPPAAANGATIALLGAYILLIGAPPPAVRAGVMLALVIASRAAQRPTSRWAVVAVGSSIPLADPYTITDLGWQLSVAGTVALVAGGALARRVLPRRRWRGWRRSLATAAIISVVATAATAPLVAWTFGRLSLVGPLTNLVADPVMGLLQPLLFLTLCLPMHQVEVVLAAASHLLILAFDAIATCGAAIPGGSPAVMPSAFAALAAAVAAVALLAACLAREPVRPLLVGLFALAVMIAGPLVTLPRDRTELHMIDVGQGDALALRTRAGHWVVIDAGRVWSGGDAGRATVVPYIAHRGGPVALFILSHPHADHVGGAASLLDALGPRTFVDPGYTGTSPPYRAALSAVRRDGIRWRRVHPGDSLVVDEAVITLLAPDSAWASRLADANLASTVASIRVGDVRMLFTGDAEAPEEEWLLAHAAGSLAADVLKVGHHGSRTSTTPAFLAAVHPRVALVSVGAGNSYGLPNVEVMDALRGAGAEVLRTDRLGTVIVRTDGRTVEVEARGERWKVP